MNALTMNLGYERTTLDLPTLFIDHYMTDCIPVYPLIYIWSLRQLLDGKSTSFGEIGERFHLTESDVIKAWQHWEAKGLVKIEDATLTFLPIPAPASAMQDTAPMLTLVEPIKPEKPEAISMCTKPQYTAQELAIYRTESRDVERLFARAEKTLGKLLSYNDMNIIFGFHDWLRLPTDVIEYLLTYCADNDHRNLRYIEKCALDWADNHINDLEKALTYVQNFDRGYRTILQYMGICGYPTPSQKKFMDRWVNEWQMSIEMIQEACDRSTAQANKPKFAYVDKVLAAWHEKGITSLDAAQKEDIDFNKTRSKAKAPASSKPRTNRFINFNQRENDYAMYEKLERAYREQKYKVSE
ncbi:MAG: DnaD domain protein [Defluviitaleaceae bacterium]|nr:DnaD domain protein [Defluviitaleaceae bacterium]